MSLLPKCGTILSPGAGHNFYLSSRCLSLSAVTFKGSHYKKIIKDHSVKEFPIYNRQGHKQFKEEQFRYRPKYPDIKVHTYGVRDVTINHYVKPEQVAEKIPELIVPDLEGCELKPYVSYAVTDINQDQMTSQDLFNVIYGPKIVADFKAGKLDTTGQSTEPSENEQLTADEAYVRARQTGSDIFQGGEPENKLYKLDIPVGKANA